MFEANLNFAAIIAVTLGTLVTGYFYYGPLLFGKAWLRLMDKTEIQLSQNAGKSYFGALFSHFVLAIVLAHFVSYVGASTFQEGMQLGAWTWLGFVATTHTINNLFQARDKDLLMLDLGYHLINLLLMGGVLTIWT